MEKANNVYVYPASFGWTDLGTWGSLYKKLSLDKNENTITGKMLLLMIVITILSKCLMKK